MDSLEPDQSIDVAIIDPLSNDNDDVTEFEKCCEHIGVEMDEMWSYIHDKHNQCWLWWAIDHDTGIALAFTFGTRKHSNLDTLMDLLTPFPVNMYYTDKNYAYESRIPAEKLIMTKKNTQRIEHYHLTLRTRIKRLARKTICFSKLQEIHEAVVGTFINIFFFGCLLTA